ncbi:MAG: response regulator transcription factor [Calditrichaceae bacterium]|nr:response regulator transcription factor [Calditrichaceae bacterium]MBN2708674.1 response regulator transcription factor [Calditrichaceae bacterium]RQV96761.1 MAG: DNA-binding response regulator [Calditrichota bacterium]
MHKKPKILLVEDEDSMAIGLEYNLTEENYDVTWVKDGQQALDKFSSAEFDLIVLDIMLPFIDGFEVAEKIRFSDPQIPILMLTARSDVKDRVRGLEAGADDYLTKPFHLEEFLLRIKGMLKRKQWYKDASQMQPTAEFGPNQINFENLTAFNGEKEFKLTVREAMLLKYLIENKDRVISRDELLENVWNVSSEVETRTVDNFIARLRKYFESDQNKPIHIQSIRGIGYLFKEHE